MDLNKAIERAQARVRKATSSFARAEEELAEARERLVALTHCTDCGVETAAVSLLDEHGELTVQCAACCRKDEALVDYKEG